MESMSQFVSEKDMWEARALRFAAALVDAMDGVEDHDIQSHTGLPWHDCESVAEARSDAKTLLRASSDSVKYTTVEKS